MRRFYRLYESVWQLNKSQSFRIVPKRDLKFSADIKWVRPTREPVYSPINSGDLEGIALPPKSTIRLDFQNSEELKNASDEVKKVFSLNCMPRKYTLDVYKQLMIDKVKRHDYDNNSKEVKIAACTAIIRFNQPLLEENPKNKKLVVKTKELIDKRKKLLKDLRLLDYKRFEWLLEQLNIVYKPVVKNDAKVTRKKSLTLLAKLRIAKQKEEKLAEYKKSLDEQKVPFLEKKIEKLKWIRDMELQNNLPSSVANEEIDDCIKKLDEVKIQIAERAKRGYVRNIHPYFIEPYDEKLLIQIEQGSN